jgi:Ser/Thr protein kinase RdoA (MazF antagonist)
VVVRRVPTCTSGGKVRDQAAKESYMSNSSSEALPSAIHSFYQLDAHTILDAVDSFGVKTTGRCLQLNSMENRVYEVEIEVDESEVTAPSDRFRVVKFYRPGRWTEDQIREEHAFLFELKRQEIPVLCPVSDDSGETLLKDPVSGVWFTLFYKFGGRHAYELNGDQLQWVGRLMARIHSVGASKTAKFRNPLSLKTYGQDHIEFLKSSSLVPAFALTQLESIVQRLVQVTSDWFAEEPMIRLHGDAHPGNLLYRDEQFFWVDFDDMVQGPAMQDLWLLLPEDHRTNPDPLNSLLFGYEQFRSINRTSIRLIEPLRALRMLHYAAWIARRWEDPIFPRTFPHFGTEGYWGGLCRDLQEIVYSRLLD